MDGEAAASAAAVAPAKPLRRELLLALIGFNLMLLNYTLIRQMTTAFRDHETSALVMTLAYFAGISLGYLRSHSLPADRVRALLPLFLVFQVVLATTAPLLVHRAVAVGGVVPAYVGFFVVVALGSTSLYSVFLPSLIESAEGELRRLYTAEIVGSLVALVLLPAIAAAGMAGTWAAYFASFGGIAYLLGTSRATLAGLSLAAVAFLVGFDTIDRKVTTAYFKKYYDNSQIEEVIFTRYTPYHKIDVARTTNGDRILFLNDKTQFAPAGHHRYSYYVAEYPARLLDRPKVCVVGCGSMSTVGRMGDLVESIRIVDLDTGVFETSKEFFPEFNRLDVLKNWTFQSDDAKHFLATTDERFGLIVDDIPPARTRQVALTYTREFFELVRARLSPGGIFSLPTLLDAKSNYGRRILATLADVFQDVFVLNSGGSSYCFATADKWPFTRDRCWETIDVARRDGVQLMDPAAVRAHVAGTGIITVNNMADLIRD